MIDRSNRCLSEATQPPFWVPLRAAADMGDSHSRKPHDSRSTRFCGSCRRAQSHVTKRLPVCGVAARSACGKEGRKHLALRPQKPLTSLRLIRDWGSWGVGNFVSNTYWLRCHRQNDSALRWAIVCFINCVGKVTRQRP